MGRGALAAGLAALSLGLAACGEADTGGAPNVIGLPLDAAKEKLDRAGFTSAESSDALLGVIIESNFTVCDQEPPNGKLVPLEVSKEC